MLRRNVSEIGLITHDCLVEKLKHLEHKRLGEIFKKTDDDDEVQIMVDEITQDIRDNETKLKEIMRCKPTSMADEKIKANVEIVVAKRLQELTHELRQRQRRYVAKVTELHGGEPSRLDLSDDDEVT